MSGGFFRGTSADQDTRFSNKQAKLLKTQKFPAELEQLVDMTKVKMDVIRPWIATRVTELLGFEDEVLINFIYGLLDGKEINGKQVQIQLTGFMEKNTGKFMKELWTLLLSAQNNASGVPQQLLDAKEEEIRKKKAETDFLANEIQKKREKENREVDEQRFKKMDDGVEKAANAALEPNSKNMRSRAMRNRPEDEEVTEKRNGVSGRSSDRHKSRSMSRSPKQRGRSFSRGRSSHSPPRLSMSPRQRDHHDSFSPRLRSSYSRRSRSTSHCKSLSPTLDHSPSHHSSPSPNRRSPHQSPSPIPVRNNKSPTPVRRRRSPTPVRRRRSPSPMRRRRSPSPVRRRRSPSPVWRRRSPSPVRRRRSPSPGRRRRSPSPGRRRRSPSLGPRRRSPSPRWRRRSPSLVRRRRSPSPGWRRRSPSLTRRRRSPSPARRRRSPSLARHHRSPSPTHGRMSSSPVRHRRSPSPMRRHRLRSPMRQHGSLSSSPIQQFDRSLSPVHRRTPSPMQHRSPLPTRHHKSPSTSRSKSPLMQQRLSPKHHKRSLTPSRRRSLSPDDHSSSSVERGTSSPVKRVSTQHQRKSPIQSSRDRTRNVRTSPSIPHHSRSMRSPKRDAREKNNSNNRIRASSSSTSSLERSPAPTESPRVRRSVGDDRRRRLSPIGSREKQHHRGNSLTAKEEEATYSRGSGDLEPKSSVKRSLNSSIVGKKKDPPMDVGCKVSSPESEEHSRREVPGNIDRQKSSSHPEPLLAEEQQPSYSRDGIEYDEKSHSRSNKALKIGLHKSESVAMVVEEIDNNKNKGDTYDSDLEEGHKHKTGSKEKKRHRRSDRQETSSDSDDSYDSELQRKEARRRKKEERRLRKEKKRQRREERRRKREERRSGKTKSKNQSDVYSDDGRIVAKEESNPSDGADEEEHRKLEIELRKKALESFNARKGMRQ